MEYNKLVNAINSDELNAQFELMRCSNNIDGEKSRYLDLLNNAHDLFNASNYSVFSAPGRSEVGGNHTDHQNGAVLCASVNMDTVAVVCECDDEIEFISKGFTINKVNLDNLNVVESEKYKSESIIRGVCARFKMLGYNIGGFRAYSDSTVLKGSGISSSAAFEVLVGTILSHLYNDNKVSAVEIAQIAQYAENHYFDKPCGLMDQMASSVGGFVSIDFKDVQNPIVNKIDFDFTKSNYSLCLVDTKGSHADLSDEYGLMPSEMKDVAKAMGKTLLSECTLVDFIADIKAIRNVCSDRALLRAYHYFNETNRAYLEACALKDNDINEFFRLVKESGQSSYMYLQNIYSPSNPLSQEISVALMLCENILKNEGAYRVHGGGLAGTIQAFVPSELLDVFVSKMNEVYGDDATHVLSIRSVGGYRFI